MKKITVSAPGKLELYGEHAVVYGRPCIVTSVDQRMKLTVELTKKPIFELHALDVQITNYQKPMSKLGSGDIPKGARYVEIALLNFIKKHPIKSGVKVTSKSKLNSLLGFGSSSASTVCIIKALSELTGKKLSSQQIFKIAHQTLLDIQGRGSGVDMAAVIFGGTIFFVTGGKTIKPLNLKSLPLIIGYTGFKAATAPLLNQVALKIKKYPKIGDHIFTGIGQLVPQAQKALLKGDFETAGEIMNFNQGYLSSLGVSSAKLDAMINGAKDAGSYGAKLSGAGRGDCMIAFALPSKVNAVKKAINKAGGKVINIKSNVEGVRVE